MKSLFYRSVVLLAFLSILSHAQAVEGNTFRLMAVVGHFTDIKFEVDDTVYSPRISTRLSNEYPVPRGGVLEFFKEEPNPKEGSLPLRVPVASMRIPSAQQRSLVLLAPLSDGSGLTYKLLNDDPSKHPGGTLKVWNLSHYALAQAVNRDVITVATGETGSMEVTGGSNLIHVVVSKNDKWETAFRRERRLSDSKRYYALVFDFMEDPTAEPIPIPPPALVRFFSEKVAAE